MKQQIITAFKSIQKTDTPHYITLEKALKRVQVGTSKKLIDAIRSAESKDERTELKKKLPSICFNGKFKTRSKDGLIEHSGLMITDFDQIPSKRDFNTVWNSLIKNKHIVSAFRSPSNEADGKFGIKALVKIPECNAKNHTLYFKEFNQKFKIPYWDVSNSDVSRICFESYDKDIYINYDAETFAPELKDEGYNIKDRVPLIPIDNENEIIEKIMNWNWSKDFVEGQRNNFVFDIAGAFCEYGVDENNAIGYIQNNIQYGDFSDTELINTIKSAYKRRQFNCKYFEDYKKQSTIKQNLKLGKKKITETYKIDESTFERLKEEVEIGNFWDINKNGKIILNNLKYKLFLQENGFKKHYPGDAQKPTFVYVFQNKVVETSTDKIKDFVLSHLLEIKEYQVYEYCSKYLNMFSDNYLSILDSIELIMLKDTKYKSYLAFNNGILEVTKDNIKLVDYLDIDKYIWKTQIIPRDFVENKEIENDYSKFVYNISSEKPKSIESVIGYLIHKYKSKSKNKAVILNDEVISDNPEGGTGKGLFIQGLSHIRKVSTLDGKDQTEKKSFPYQTVSQDSEILFFDDVKRNWDFESKFSLVTEGMTLERKNKDAIKLTVEESPKMVVSTNYAIKGEGNSHDRRRHEVEFAQYYGADLEPADEFGHQLFDDWNDDDFNRFYNYMVKCLQIYLKEGLIDQEAKNLEMRKFIAETAMEFYEFMQDKDNFPRNERLDKVQMFDKFTNDYQDFKKWLSRKRFTIWVQKYAKFIDVKYTAGNFNGMRFFEIQTDDKTEDNDEIAF
ncbi:MAG: BT4734/BF3469 family protein [Candidatus Babeliales bacterium]